MIFQLLSLTSRLFLLLVLRKVSVSNDNDNIAFTLIVDGKPMETKIPKNIIIEIYKVVGNFRRQ